VLFRIYSTYDITEISGNRSKCISNKPHLSDLFKRLSRVLDLKKIPTQ